MDLQEIDNVKAEKAIALRRYRRQRNLKLVSKACAAAALFVLARSSAWFPVVVDCSRNFFRSHLFVFALFHAIIFLVYALSSASGTSSPAATATSADNKHPHAPPPDLYDEYVSNSACSRRISADGDSPAPGNRFQDKHVVFSENVASPPLATNTVLPDKYDAALVVRCYRRTQSEKHAEEAAEKQNRKGLRRSDTELCRKPKRSGEETWRRSSFVNQMNSDDFNRTCDNFIATHKLKQREELDEEHEEQTDAWPSLSATERAA